MTIDAKNAYWLDEDVEGATGNHDSPAINHGIPSPNSVGKGHPMILNLKVTEDFESGGAATVEFILQDSEDGVTFADTDVHIPAVGYAALVQGWGKRHALPEDVRQHTRLRRAHNVASLTGGVMSAYLTES